MNMQSKLRYTKDGRILFDKWMKKEYTILLPNMLPIQFKLLRNTLAQEGYKVDLLETTHRGIIDEGLKSVHNDTCYPALLIIGQFIDALKSGKYDLDRVALLITQTGGGCRASNYIHLLRKALQNSGYAQVPVISLNISGLEKNPGFKATISFLRRAFYSLLYGDLLMLLANQCRPYEKNPGSTGALVETWVKNLSAQFKRGRGLRKKEVAQNIDDILQSFGLLELLSGEKIKVGVVGEIYVKYAALGNNNLEEFLLGEGVETVVPGVMDFIIYCIDNQMTDIDLYGGNILRKKAAGILKNFCTGCQNLMIDKIKEQGIFTPPSEFEHLKSMAESYVSYGNKMGEGWLLIAEMLELVTSGVPNVVCTQPFGCLPNHIVGKGMLKKIRENHPHSNIVPIDYDSGAAKINQENRLKLMILNGKQAKENEKRAAQKKHKAAVGY